MKLPMFALVYHPTLFASTLTSRRFLIISFEYATFAFERGAAAARFEAAMWSLGWESEDAMSADGKGNELVISRVEFTSIPTIDPVAVVGNDAAQALTIFITTCFYQYRGISKAGAYIPGLRPGQN